jgi:hypothetical protein
MKSDFNKLNVMAKQIIAFFSFLLLTLIGCESAGLDYDKIDFEVRKIIVKLSLGNKNPTIENKIETKKPLYRYYENELTYYKKRQKITRNKLDTLHNHKEVWLDNSRTRQSKRLENASDREKELDAIRYGTIEKQHVTSIENNMWQTEYYSTVIDSLEKLYKTVSEHSNYYEIDYEISEKFNEEVWIMDLKVWVNEESDIFKHEIINQRKNN